MEQQNRQKDGTSKHLFVKSLFLVLILSLLDINASASMIAGIEVNYPHFNDYEIQVFFCSLNGTGGGNVIGTNTLLDNVSIETSLWDPNYVDEIYFNGSGPCIYSNLSSGLYTLIYYMVSPNEGYVYNYLYYHIEVDTDTYFGHCAIYKVYIVYLVVAMDDNRGNYIDNNIIEYASFVNERCNNYNTLYLEDKKSTKEIHK